MHKTYKIGPFPGLREAATEVSWVGGTMGAIGLVESSIVQTIGRQQWSLAWSF